MFTDTLTSVSAVLKGEQPAWRAGTRLWWIWSSACIFSMVFSVFASLACYHTFGASQALRQQIEEARVQASAKADQTKATPVATNFTYRLPRTIDVQPVVSQLQHSCTQTGIELVSVQIQQQGATVDRLARLELNLTVRGNYPAIKTVLADVMGRYQNMSLRRLSMQSSLQGQANNADETKATVVLALWGAPLDPSQNPAPSAQSH